MIIGLYFHMIVAWTVILCVRHSVLKRPQNIIQHELPSSIDFRTLSYVSISRYTIKFHGKNPSWYL